MVAHTLSTSGLAETIRPEAKLRAEIANRLDPGHIDRMLKSLAREVATQWLAPRKHAYPAAWLALPR